MDKKGGILDSNNIHSTYLNINTTLGAHFNSNTSHIIHIIISTFITIIASLTENHILYWSTSRPKDNSKEDMEQSYSCIILFISKTKNILLASRFI